MCKECGTRYTPPTPKWAARLFVVVGTLLMVVGLGLMILSWSAKSSPAVVCELAAWGALVVLGYRAFAHGMSAIADPGKV